MMKKTCTIILLIIISASLSRVSSSEDTVIAKTPADQPAGFSLEDMADEYFCNVSDGTCMPKEKSMEPVYCYGF